MELKIWTPLFNLEKDMRAMFDRLQQSMGEGERFDFRPTTDMVRDNGTLTVTTELPGVDPVKDIEIAIEGDVLVIKGAKTAERELTEKDTYLHERHFGSFERRLPLPDGVDPDKIEAAYDKGVLTVRIPMPDTGVAKTHRIPVKTG